VSDDEWREYQLARARTKVAIDARKKRKNTFAGLGATAKGKFSKLSDEEQERQRKAASKVKLPWE
jgi:uncharacterized protein YhbP (UPF0306 family)